MTAIRFVLILVPFALLLTACGGGVAFEAMSSDAAPGAHGPTPSPTPQNSPAPTPKPIPTATPVPTPTPIQGEACPEIYSNNWVQVPTRPYPPYQGDRPDPDTIAWMEANKAYGPITRYGAKIHWAQSYPYGVWPTNEYVPPTENGFLIAKNLLQVMIDSTTHGSGCHEGCQWDYNPVWEVRGDINLMKLQSEGNRATLPNGNVFMLKFLVADSGKGTFAIRARIQSQTGTTVYTPELKFCVK